MKVVKKSEFHPPLSGVYHRPGKMQMDLAKVPKCSVPNSCKQLHRYFYCGFIWNYSSVAVPLSSLTSEKRPFAWTSDADATFRSLNERFTSAPIFQVPDPSLQFVVELDASDVGVGAVLSMRATSNQKLHPCIFFSC